MTTETGKTEIAGSQGKFWQIHDLLFENQKHLKDHHLREYAMQLELDMVRFYAEFPDQIHLQRIREDILGAAQSRARDTPTVYVNGRIQDVTFGLDKLAIRVDEEIVATE